MNRIELTTEEAQDILDILVNNTENSSFPHSKEFCNCFECRMRDKLREKLNQGGKP